MTSFQEFGFSEGLLRSIEDKGYDEPSPIQLKSIPAILDGKDVLASAQTGTGKTAAFVLPILQKLTEQERPEGIRPIKALILTPTRELALQVGQSVKAYAAHLPIKQATIFGGVNAKPQIKALSRSVDILVATPGRLFDLSEQKALSLSEVEFLVLDEADRMLDMGFIQDIVRILKMIPEKRQSLLFSATFSPEIKELTKDVLTSPVEVKVADDNAVAENLEQNLYFLKKSNKAQLLMYLMSSGNWEQVLIFTRTKYGADHLYEKLQDNHIPSVVIHGKKTQLVRNKALAQFKKKAVKVLVATDVAARGLDIKELPHVVNFDVPNVPEDYVHRVGRTGRAGLSGHAVTLTCDEEVLFINRIERLTQSKMKVCYDKKFSIKIDINEDGDYVTCEPEVEVKPPKPKKKKAVMPPPLKKKKPKVKKVKMKNPMEDLYKNPFHKPAKKGKSKGKK